MQYKKYVTREQINICIRCIFNQHMDNDDVLWNLLDEWRLKKTAIFLVKMFLRNSN